MKFLRVGIYFEECQTPVVELPQASLQLENNAQLVKTEHLITIGHTHTHTQIESANSHSLKEAPENTQ